ncbi:MAG: hypothetical protein NTV70_24560 [Acidobacteria bacterium]|nr:hypothetical protein [Acidobacteriota bacterium]
MKTLFVIGVICSLLAGCSRSPQVESERKLAEAQAKLDEATIALKAAQKAAEEKVESAAETAQTAKQEALTARKAAAQALAKAKEDVKRSADNLASAAKAMKETSAAVENNAAVAESAKKAALAAEAKAEEARRLAEPPKTHTLETGTAIKVRTTSLLSTKTSSTGGTFEASLAAPLEVDGYTVADKGASVEGVITDADDGGRVKGRASMTVALRRITTADGQTINIRTDSESREAKSSVKKDALKVGIVSGIGAAIGAIAGGGRGAAIGAGAGAGAGTGVVLATKGEAAVFPAESLLTFRLAAPVTVTEAKR